MPCHEGIRRILLTVVILAPASVFPTLLPIGQAPAEVPSMLSENVSFADLSSGHPMDDHNNSSKDDDNNDLRQLAHILAGAYGNALMHDTPNANLEAKDLLLESASIR